VVSPTEDSTTAANCVRSSTGRGSRRRWTPVVAPAVVLALAAASPAPPCAPKTRRERSLCHRGGRARNLEVTIIAMDVETLHTIEVGSEVSGGSCGPLSMPTIG